MNHCTCEIMRLLHYAKVTQVKQTNILVCIHKFCKNLCGEKKGKYTQTHHSITCFPCESCPICKSISSEKKSKQGIDYGQESKVNSTCTVVKTKRLETDRDPENLWKCGQVDSCLEASLSVSPLSETICPQDLIIFNPSFHWGLVKGYWLFSQKGLPWPLYLTG